MNIREHYFGTFLNNDTRAQLFTPHLTVVTLAAGLSVWCLLYFFSEKTPPQNSVLSLCVMTYVLMGMFNTVSGFYAVVNAKHIVLQDTERAYLVSHYTQHTATKECLKYLKVTASWSDAYQCTPEALRAKELAGLDVPQ